MAGSELSESLCSMPEEEEEEVEVWTTVYRCMRLLRVDCDWLLRLVMCRSKSTLCIVGFAEARTVCRLPYEGLSYS